MQGIDKIIEKIVNDAELDAKETQKQTQLQIKALEIKHDEQTKSQIDGINKSFDEKADSMKSRAVTMADLERRRNNLAIKRELVELSFKRANKKIMQLNDKQYLDFIEKLLMELEPVSGEVIIGRDDKRIDKQVIDGVIKKLSAKKIDSKITLSQQKGDFSGGFILRDGRIEINCKLDMLIQTAKRDLEQQVVRILFEGES